MIGFYVFENALPVELGKSSFAFLISNPTLKIESMKKVSKNTIFICLTKTAFA